MAENGNCSLASAYIPKWQQLHSQQMACLKETFQTWKYAIQMNSTRPKKKFSENEILIFSENEDEIPCAQAPTTKETRKIMPDRAKKATSTKQVATKQEELNDLKMTTENPNPNRKKPVKTRNMSP